ncbi:MAG TPA: hypothetical protein VHW74_02685 [Mycobacteriales bacterium]|nr:hypothetical protein [Mycobacteriales bacterium]
MTSEVDAVEHGDVAEMLVDVANLEGQRSYRSAGLLALVGANVETIGEATTGDRQDHEQQRGDKRTA